MAPVAWQREWTADRPCRRSLSQRSSSWASTISSRRRRTPRLLLPRFLARSWRASNRAGTCRTSRIRTRSTPLCWSSFWTCEVHLDCVAVGVDALETQLVRGIDLFDDRDLLSLQALE